MGAKKMTPEQIERESVEWIFHLTGGELNDKPLTYTYSDEIIGYPIQSGQFLYHYDGVPEYAQGDFDDGAEYFTAILYRPYGNTMTEITVDGKLYQLVRSFASSGESDCPVRDCDDDPFEGETCPFCERPADNLLEKPEHGCVYIGEGWGEFVYRHDPIAHMRSIARNHNLEIWQAEIVVIHCAVCEDDSEVPHHSDVATNYTCSYCARQIEAPITHTGRKGWYWWSCSPGCLPDGEAQGPFDSERDALEDATNGLED